jgi:hypothetical protein
MKRTTIIEEESAADSIYTVIKIVFLAIVIILFLNVWVKLPV